MDEDADDDSTSSGHDDASPAEVEDVLAKIDASLTAGDLGHAFSGYLYLLQGDNPGCKEHIRDDFATVLHQWAEHQEAAGRREDALWCYEVARRLWPENAEIHNSMGVFLHRLGQDEEAVSCFRLALEIDPELVSAQKNLSNIVGSPFKGWHFPMLNDKKRNLGYQTAIAKAVSQGHDRVLDIGSGTGLLSMFAVMAGAKSVVACEESQDMVRLSHDVLAANQMQDKIHLLHKLSTDLTVPEDVPNRVSLVVTEIFDAGLFGEGAVSTLRHAWKHLLLPPKTSDSQPAGSHGRVIPSGAVIYAQVVQCRHIRRQYRVLNETICNLNVGAVRLGTGCQKLTVDDREEKGTSRETSWETSQNLRKPHTDYQEEPYTSERISEVPLSYQALTPALRVLEIDFNNPQILTADHPTSKWKHVDFPILSNGRADAIISWFDLRLDETETLSSSPASGSCWEQTVFPVSPSNHTLPKSDGNLEDCLCFRKGDNITVAVSCWEECLHLKYVKSTRHAVSKMENSPSTGEPASSHEEAVEDMVTSFERNLVTSAASSNASREENSSADSPTKLLSFTLQPDTISVLNDQKYNTACYNAIKNLILESKLLEDHQDIACADSLLAKPTLVTKQQSTSHLYPDSSRNSSRKSRTSKFSVLDISNSVSLAGLFAAKHYSSTKVCFPNSQSETRSLIQTLARANGIADCVEFGAEPHPLSPSSEATFDLLATDLVAPCGTLRERVLEDIAVGRVCALKPTGRVLPASATVFAMCVECASLQGDSEVLGTNSTMGLKIDQFINKYKVSTFQDIHLSSRVYKQLSSPFLAFHLDLNEQPNPDTSDLPSFVHQTTTHEFKAIDDGTITAIPFWFDVSLDPSNHVNTLDTETHWRQAAFLLPEGQSVRKGDPVKVTARIEDSSFVFTVVR